MDNLQSRIESRIQLTTDGHKAYLEAVEYVFGGDADYAQLIKLYGHSDRARRRNAGLIRNEIQTEALSPFSVFCLADPFPAK